MTTSAASLRSVGEGGEGTVRKRVRKDPASRRAELVRAAREVFGRCGYAETGITEIAHEAQVSKALLYHYFPDGRPELYREVMDRLVQAWGDLVFHTVIRRTVKFSDSTVAGEPITTYASSSSGAEAYRQLAREVLDRCLDG